MKHRPYRSALIALFCLVLFAWPVLVLPTAAQQPTPQPTPVPTPTPTWWQIAIPDPVEPILDYGIWLPAILVVMLIFVVLFAAVEGLRDAVKGFIKATIEKTVGRVFSRNRASQRRYLDCLREHYGKIKPLGIARHDRVLLDIDEIHVPLRIEATRQDSSSDATANEFTNFISDPRRPELHAFTLLSNAKLLPRPGQRWTKRLAALRDRLLRRRHYAYRQMQEDRWSVSPPRTYTRLLLLGVAGSGKTTTLRYAAIRVAEAWTRRRNRTLKLDDLGLYLPRPPLPVYVRLVTFSRAYAGVTPDPDDLLHWIDQEMAGWNLSDVNEFSAAIRDNRCLLLFDGLDEAGDEERRAAIAAMLAQLAERYPGNRYLVASRPAGYGGRVHLANFHAVTLDALNADEARNIMRKWFIVATEQSQRATEESNRLWSAVRHNERLHQMADRPLLVIAMAALHFDETTLPDERARLYEVLIELLLGKWFLRRLEKTSPQDEEKARRLRDERPRIEDLAFLMQRGDNQASEVTLTQAQEWLVPGYGAAHHPDAARSRVYNLLETLDLDSGLMQRRDEDTYAFSHLSFQEYLAACALDELDKTRQRGAGVDWLLARSHDPRWREVNLLAAGRWSSGRDIDLSAKLVDGLLQQASAPALELAADMLTDIRPEKLPDLCETTLTHLLAQGSSHFLVLAGKALSDGWQHTMEQSQETITRLYACAFCNPPIETDPRTRNQAAELLDRLDADDRPELNLKHPDYWATRIEPGPFVMGDDNSQDDDEKPAFTCTTHQPYALARFPVTNRQYLQFLTDLERQGRTEEAQERRPQLWPGRRYRAGEGNHPVVAVSWEDACAFAQWVNDTLLTGEQRTRGEQIRLPTEPEWERAAAYPVVVPGDDPGAGKGVYPWSDGPEDLAESIVSANTSESGIGGASVVGIFPHGAATCGAEELAGNVWERCSTPRQNYPLPMESPPENLYSCEDKARIYVLRGGAWGYNQPYARCSVRVLRYHDLNRKYSGLRLARVFSCV